jgi:hypothetical protein
MKTGLGNVLTGSRLFGAEMHENPYPVYYELRERDPVHWDEALRAWVLTRYEDVSWALTALSSDRVTRARDRFQDEALQPLFNVLATLMLQRDEPDHTRIRSLVQKAFLRTTVEQWADSIQRRVYTLLQAGLRSGQMDFMQDFAVPLPVLVISEIVGIPADDRERVKQWCDDFALVATNFYAHISPEQLQQGLHSTMAFRTYLADQVEALHRSPQDNLLSSLVHAEEEGHRLTLDELLANALLLTICHYSDGQLPLSGRLGARDGHAVPVDQADRLALRRHAQRPGHVLAGTHQGQGWHPDPVPPRH